MCGIAGIVSYSRGSHVDPDALLRIRDAQVHRGPDDQGAWIDAERRVGLAQRRLSIIDLSPLGHQPMSTSDERLHVVFNGEIYNFADLRRELESLGHVFVSMSDTEVILAGYREWGEGVLNRLRGMFAFALYDTDRRSTLLARDPLGIKPLYYCRRGGNLFFASEVQAIRSGTGVDDVDPESLARYLQWGSIAAPRTFYKEIRALPAGHFMWVHAERVGEPEAYYRIEDEIGSPEPMTAAEASEHIREALLDTIRCHLVADVEVGAFLSGGVDSPSLVGLLAEVHRGPISTVNLACDVPELDESALAEEAARFYGSRHHRVDVRVDDLRDQVTEAIDALDQPSIDGINVYLVSRAAVESGLKVAVNGVGADEIFGGYSSFASVDRLRGWARRLDRIPGWGSVRSPVARVVERLPNRRLAIRAAQLAEFGHREAGIYWAQRGLFSGTETARLLSPDFAAQSAGYDPIEEVERRTHLEEVPESEHYSLLELKNYLEVQLLRDADAMSMRHSLEVRTPLVDRVLIRELFRVPPELRRMGPAKRQLRDSVRPPLPPAFWQRKKTGFTLPFEKWLREDALGLGLPDHPALDPVGVRKVETDFLAGKVHWSRLWSLIVLSRFLT